MAVKIKLKRLGAKRNPQYRIVVADARSRRDGRAIEEIGLYHPKEEPSLIKITSERAQYWLGVGAQPTQAVQRLLEVTGDWQTYHGLPGAEGTLKVAEPRPDRRAIFAAAALSAADENEKFSKDQANKAKAARQAAAQELVAKADSGAPEQSAGPVAPVPAAEGEPAEGDKA